MSFPDRAKPEAQRGRKPERDGEALHLAVRELYVGDWWPVSRQRYLAIMPMRITFYF